MSDPFNNGQPLDPLDNLHPRSSAVLAAEDVEGNLAPRMVNSYRDLKVAETDGLRHDVEVRTSVGFLIALRKHREVSLRDEFAKAAVMQLSSDWQPESAARLAYQLADAMLKEREA